MNPKDLKARAREALGCATYDPQKMALIYIGVQTGVQLLLYLMDVLLSLGIQNTGGLAGIETRSALQTVYEVAQLAVQILMPFWQLGWLFVTMQYLRRQETEPSQLLTGFRRFGPLFRLMLLEGLLMLGLAFGAVYAAGIVLSFTAWGGNMLDMITADTMSYSLLLYFGLIFVFLLLFLVPQAYRLRLSHYFLLDDPKIGARAAMAMSRQAMQGNCLKTFRLDLSFWWYYLMLLVVIMVSIFGNTLSILLLPENLQTLGTALVFILCLVAEFCLSVKFQPMIDVTYAACYEALAPKPEAEEIFDAIDENL